MFFYTKYSANSLSAFRASREKGETPPFHTHPLVAPTNLQILVTPLLQLYELNFKFRDTCPLTTEGLIP